MSFKLWFPRNAVPLHYARSAALCGEHNVTDVQRCKVRTVLQLHYVEIKRTENTRSIDDLDTALLIYLEDESSKDERLGESELFKIYRRCIFNHFVLIYTPIWFLKNSPDIIAKILLHFSYSVLFNFYIEQEFIIFFEKSINISSSSLLHIVLCLKQIPLSTP